MSTIQFDSIDWNTIERSLSRKSHGFHTWFSKHHSGWCGIGKNMKRWGFWTTDKCPCCLTHSESDTNHMFKCKNQEMREHRNKVYTELYEKLNEMDTSPQILEILKSSIQGNLLRMKTGRKDLDKIIINLKVIGQFNILNGFIPTNLCEIQYRFYTE